MSTGSTVMSGEIALHLRSLLSDLFALQDITTTQRGGAQLRGHLLRPPEEAYPIIAKRLQPLGYTPLLRRQGEVDVIHVLPGLAQTPRSRNWLAALLFALTVLSVLFMGTGMSEPDPQRGFLATVLSGVPYMLTLLGILTAHELGHYFAGRRHGVPTSLPYFIPMPYPPFGTMGAFIRLQAPPTNRRALLAIAAAGPLAGLTVAVPLLFVGLKLSQLGPTMSGVGIQEGNSLFYLLAKYLVFGRLLPTGGVDVHLHPVAFAAWAGLFVTGLNLIPAGQLDGGHIAYALIGSRARYLTVALVGALILLGLVWPGWFLWAGLLFFLGQTFAIPLDDVTRLDGRRVALAIAMLVILALIFTPVPLTVL